MTDSPPRVVPYYGYELVITTVRSDGTYHDRAGVRVEVRRAGSDEVLHVVERSTRSTHQLSKRYRPAADPIPEAVGKAQQWVLAHQPDAVASQAAEREAAEERNRTWRRKTFEGSGEDPIAYVLSLPSTLSTTEAAKALGLGSARKLNPLLVQWGIQRRRHDAYETVDPAHGEQVGFYGTLRWTAKGLKAIWDASVRHGSAAGGDEEFARRLRTNTNWFAGIELRNDDGQPE